MRKLVACAMLVLLASSALAIDVDKAFDDPEQNQSIKDSNAFLAGDLRREIRRMLGEGKTDEEIYDFLVTRYGEFALYRPRMSGKTLILWIAPIALLLAGGFVLVNILRRRMAMPIDGDAAAEE
jgi:cytochrome c-type biogenesis protein CcmH